MKTRVGGIAVLLVALAATGDAWAQRLPAQRASPSAPSSPRRPSRAAAVRATRARTMAITGWTLMGLGHASLGFGLGFWMQQDHIVDWFNGSPGCGLRNGEPVGPIPCRSAYNELQRYHTMALAGFIVGGTLMATGVLLLILKPASRPARRQTNWWVTPGPALLGGSIGATF